MPFEIGKDLKSLITESLESRGLDIEKLSQLTGISQRYLLAIQNMTMDQLPAFPYMRGYLKRISQALNLNYNDLFELYKSEFNRKKTENFDRLPINRFAIKHISKEKQLVSILAALLVIYLVINGAQLLGKPPLEIINPSESTISVNEKIITFIGQAAQRDKLTINGEEVLINSDGTFSKSYPLQEGLNTIEFKVKRFLGQETKIIKQVWYQPESIINKSD